MMRPRMRRLWLWLEPLCLLVGAVLAVAWLGAVLAVAMLEAAR